MNSQESVDTYGHHKKERSVSKQNCDVPKHGFKEIRRIDNACDVQRLNQTPTPRSDTARLRSNDFKVFGNDEAFYWVAVSEPSHEMRTGLSPTSKND